MKKFFSLVFLFPLMSFGQSIFSNAITDTNANTSNPYTIGQIVDPNISVSGIGRGSGLTGVKSNDRYDAKSWSLLFDPTAYFEFTITPNTEKKLIL